MSGCGVAEHVRNLAEDLEQAGGPTVRAVILYGSHLLSSARPDRYSAVDLVVVVDDYGAFYRSMAAAGELPRPPWLMAGLAHVLPPNVIAFVPREGREGIAKCLVVRADHFLAALGPRPRDHFLLGRMVQHVAIVRARDEVAREEVLSALGTAHRGVLDWMRPYLEGPFDAHSLGRALLAVCYSGELRPEARDRAHTIYEAQRDHFQAALGPVLEEAVSEGGLVRAGPGDEAYSWAGELDGRSRTRWRRHFRRSKRRATFRWLKHTVTFANWLPYVVRKVERHTGREIQLTRLERKLPLVFLWPRVIHVLLTRPPSRDD